MAIGTRKAIKLVDETPVLTDGEHEPNERVVYRGWAEVRQVNSSRNVQNNQTNTNKLFELRFRYRSTVQLHASIKVEYRRKRYAVQSIDREQEKNFYWVIRVEAKSFD